MMELIICKLYFNIFRGGKIITKYGTYTGNFLNYKPIGKNTLVTNSGDKCTYETQNNFIKVIGAMHYGEKIEMKIYDDGHFKGTQYHKGLLTQTNGKFENGLMKYKLNPIYSKNNNLPLNYPKEVISDPKSIKFRNGKIEMKVKIIFEDDSFYEGDIKDKEFDGKGKLYINDGDKYEGEWKNGLREGKGILYYNDGDKYEGEWKMI